MREYILLVATIDSKFNETVQLVIDGKIKDIGFESAVDESSGGALAKTVSVPKVEDDTEFR